jgi:cytochrome c
MRFPGGNVLKLSTGAIFAALALSGLANAANEGQIAFNNHCRTCHSTKQGDNRLGPSLYGVVGRKAGTASGYPNYSQALAQSGIVWDPETLDKFIANPEAVIPNNNMKPYSGLTDPAVRKQIIEYLQSAGKAGSGKEATK